jgi:hypothetical protein
MNKEDREIEGGPGGLRLARKRPKLRRQLLWPSQFGCLRLDRRGPTPLDRSIPMRMRRITGALKGFTAANAESTSWWGFKRSENRKRKTNESCRRGATSMIGATARAG